MMIGTISKLVTTFGSQWGRIRPKNETREVFFNVDSLTRWQDFVKLHEGQAVEFEEQADFVNGSHATSVVISRTPRVATARG